MPDVGLEGLSALLPAAAEAGTGGLASAGADALGAGVSGIGADVLSGAAGAAPGLSGAGGDALGFAGENAGGSFNPFESFGISSDAINSGAFDPVGSNFTTGQGAALPDAFAAPTTATGAASFALPTGAAPGALGADLSSLGNAGPISGASGAGFGATTGGNFGVTPGAFDSLMGGGAAGTPAAGADALTAGTQGAGAAGAGANAAPGFVDKAISGFTDPLMKNPIGTALAAGGLGYNLMQGQHQPEGTDQLRSSANALAAQGAQMRQYLESGTLPPGVKASVDNATAGAKARIIAQHASRGLPTDPSKNSALAQELNQLQMNSAIATADIGQKLLTTGINETALSNQLYEALVKIDQTQTANVGKAIANFATALGGQRGTTIQIGR